MKLIISLVLCFFSYLNGETLKTKILGPTSYDDRIGIVGAGCAGIHMALLLKEKGFKNIEILEKNDRVGGKSWTYFHRNVPHELGTFYMAPDHQDNIIKLVKKYAPDELVEMVPIVSNVDESADILPIYHLLAFSSLSNHEECC